MPFGFPSEIAFAFAGIPILDSIVPNIVLDADNLMNFLKPRIPEVMREGHINALSKNLTARGRSESYEPFRWFVLVANEPLILGDSVCLFETAGKRRFKPLDDKGEDVQKIYLPISSDQMLIGTPYCTDPELDSRTLNRAFARCSLEFFISSVQSVKPSLVESIGTWAGMLTPKELDSIISGIIFEKLDFREGNGKP